MSNSFLVEILTPAGEVAHEMASSVHIPSLKGELEILPKHEDLAGLLGSGVVLISSNGKNTKYAVSKGAFKVESGNLVLFAEFGIASSKINLTEVEKNLQESSDALKSIGSVWDESYMTALDKLNRFKAMKEAV